MSVLTQFNPAIKFGCKVQVKSSFTAACGLYTVLGLQHHVESNKPGGA